MNSMIETPLIVPIKVLQMHAASLGLPMATIKDKIKCQSHYINFKAQHN